MSILRPSNDQLGEIAASLGITLSASQIADYQVALQGNFDAYDQLDALPDFLPEVRYPRHGVRVPGAEENRYGAWQCKSEIRGKANGPLAGKSVAIKDNIAVAGLPMLNGTFTLDGYLPEVDATVVTRLLDAGVAIAGKAVCEALCFSGGSHTAASGPVHNPLRHGYSAGGSSSGCAALVAAGEVDLAVGSDQGGSVRIPASFCGVYGMKPTHGLVPYTGAMPIETTLDHLGPITAGVRDNALMLEVLAGADGLDPRQSNAAQAGGYVEALSRGVAGMRIGILKEGFGLANSEALVDQAVLESSEVFRALGATVEEVSLPMHALGPVIWLAIAAEGATQQMMKGNSHGFNWRGLYLTGMMEHHARWREQAGSLPDTVKTTMILGEYLSRQYQGRYYGKAQNIARQLRQAYDSLFEKYDLLLMPTLPIRATPLPSPDAALPDYLGRAFEMLGNTCGFDVSGHPAMSIPCAIRDGLPIGLQLVGKHFGEADIYRAAHAFEQATDWRSR
ncbi:amidase [Pseudomonas sp. TCU-HL1]|uniref:amidase n=1 Tax=Pseudomonas sp. TCU-HL1 TaxID=1856685 RepID=UPI00083CAAD0|nr:amidase [Pseudomonas sp. TCU-HL1]AOE85763.1 amidase [Pseudomonas sp. TCU-HL1]